MKFSDWLLEGKDPEHEMENAKNTELFKRITLIEFYPVFMERHGQYQNKSMQEVNREAAMVKGMLFRAVEWDIITNNPLRGFKLFPEAEKRQVNLGHGYIRLV